MIVRGLLIFTLLASNVLALPVTPSHLENEDVQVIKCIVEVLADVLSRPRPLPVNQLCLDTLRTDDRLVTILRHRNFLKELQEIAIEGTSSRAQRHRDSLSVSVTQGMPQYTDQPDQSMLDALSKQTSLLADKRDPESKVEEEEEKSQERDGGESNEIGRKEGVNKEKEAKQYNHISDDSMFNDGGEAEAEEKRLSPEEPPMDKTEEEQVTKEKTGLESDINREGAEQNLEGKKSKEEEEEKKKRSAFFLHDSATDKKAGEEEAQEEGEVKGGTGAGSKRWNTKSQQHEKRRAEEERSPKVKGQQEEAIEKDGEEEVKRSEVKELQIMARRPAGDTGDVEEEGSTSRKGEDPEIESLAAIESELESVARKLHELRRG